MKQNNFHLSALMLALCLCLTVAVFTGCEKTPTMLRTERDEAVTDLVASADPIPLPTDVWFVRDGTLQKETLSVLSDGSDLPDVWREKNGLPTTVTVKVDYRVDGDGTVTESVATYTIRKTYWDITVSGVDPATLSTDLLTQSLEATYKNFRTADTEVSVKWE